MKAFRFFILFMLVLSGILPVNAESRKSRLTYNELSVDLPFDGGGMLMYSRMWRWGRHLDGGFFAGGGQIIRKFDLSRLSPDDVQMRTEAWVLPFFGPQLTMNFNIVGISLGYGVFWAKTDIEAAGSGIGRPTGRVSGWGSGFYSPLLVFDFYNRKYDMVFGVGLGGFLGTSYRTLTASSPQAEIRTDASPLDSLTVHVRILWADGRKERLRRDSEDDDF